jgi:predicted nucleotidyltransferase
MLPNDLRELLLVFNEHGVEYLLVGGYAVGVYAEPRATKDMDVFLRPERDNSEAVYRALAAYEAPLNDIAPADFCNEPDFVFQIGQPPLRIDLLQKIDGVTFEEAWSKRTEAFIDGVPVHVISAEHLIQNKLASGRLQDLADADAVRDAINEK